MHKEKIIPSLAVMTICLAILTCAVVSASPQSPNGLKARSDETMVYLSWINSEGALSYEVFRDGHSLGMTNDNFYEDVTIRDHYVHSYYIVAISGLGERSNQSDTVEASVKNLSAPLLSARFSENGVILSWYSVQGADGYRIYVNNMELERVNGLQYIDTVEASLGNSYYVIAYNDVGDSAPSNSILASDERYNEVGCCDDASLDYYIYEITGQGSNSHTYGTQYIVGTIFLMLILVGATIFGISKSSSKYKEVQENDEEEEHIEVPEQKKESFHPDGPLDKILSERRLEKGFKRNQEE